jgi:hypothetical protein
MLFIFGIIVGACVRFIPFFVVANEKYTESEMDKMRKN